MLDEWSDNESDSGSLNQLTVNEHYAKAFAYKKEREELEKRECIHAWAEDMSILTFVPLSEGEVWIRCRARR